MVPWVKAAAVLTAIVAGGIQLLPYGRSHDPLPAGTEAPWPDEATRDLAMGACYDCHSGSTEWPWYSNVAPMSWLVQRDVDAGRDELRFDDWDPDDAEDAAETIAEGDMPPRQYTWLHRDARLSFEEKERLIDALDAMADADDAAEDAEDEERDDDDDDADNSGPGSRNRGRGSD